jgi:hypothetical protein
VDAGTTQHDRLKAFPCIRRAGARARGALVPTLSKNDDRRNAEVTFLATTSSSLKFLLLRRRMPLEDNTNLAQASKSHTQTQRAAVSLHPDRTAVRRFSNTRTVHTTRPRVEPRRYRKQPYPCHERLLAVSRRITTRSPCQSMESGRICWYVLSQEIRMPETLLVP